LLSIAELPLAEGRTYIVPMLPGEVLPAIPAGGFDSKAEVAGLPGARWIEALGAATGLLSGAYAAYRRTTQRNLYPILIL